MCAFVWLRQGLARRSLWVALGYEMRSDQCVPVLKFRLDIEKLTVGPNCTSLPDQSLGVAFWRGVTLFPSQLCRLISEPYGERGRKKDVSLRVTGSRGWGGGHRERVQNG